MIELPARRGKDDAASLLESADAAASDEPRVDLPLFDKVPLAPVPRRGGPPHRRRRRVRRRPARGRVLPRRGPARSLRRGRGNGDDFRAAGLPKFIVPRAPLVLDLAHRDARKPGLLVVDRGRRVPLGGVFERRRGMGQRRRPRLRAEPLRGRRPGVPVRLYAPGSGGRRLRARLADLLPRAPLI